MPLAKEPVLLFATLLLFWLLLSGTAAPQFIGVGVVIAGAIAWWLRGAPSLLTGLRLSGDALFATLGYLGYFLTALLRANLAMAAIVLDPAMPIRPAIVRVHTRLTHPNARLLLANSITLTPGTLSVELDGNTLYVHWVVADSTDPDAATGAIVAGFERYLERMYA